MKQHIQTIISKYHAQGILLDTNLLLAFCIGAVNPQYISRFKRTRAYIAEDFTLLSQLMKRFTMCVTTPNILTEVSNLANSLPGEYHVKFQQIFSQLVPTFLEEYQESKQLVTHRELLRELSETFSETRVGGPTAGTAAKPLQPTRKRGEPLEGFWQRNGEIDASQSVCCESKETERRDRRSHTPGDGQISGVRVRNGVQTRVHFIFCCRRSAC